MRVSWGLFTRRDGWVEQLAGLARGTDADLVLVFGATDLMPDAAVIADVGRVGTRRRRCAGARRRGTSPGDGCWTTR